MPIRKDGSISENVDLEHRHEEDRFKTDADRKYSDEARGIAEVNVKNANASGDGSIEKRDEELPSNSNSNDAENY